MEQDTGSLIKTEKMSFMENAHSPERPKMCLMEQGQGLTNLYGDITVHIREQDIKTENMSTIGSVNFLQHSAECANESGECFSENIILLEDKNIYTMPPEAKPYIKYDNNRFSVIDYRNSLGETAGSINEHGPRFREISDPTMTMYDEMQIIKIKQEPDISPLIKKEKHSILPETFGDCVNEQGQSPCFSESSCSLQEDMKNPVLEAKVLPLINEVATSIASIDSPQRSNEQLSGERPYNCPECNKTFTKASNLKVHARTHSGEKPYRCILCGKCFSQSSHLPVHMLTHTGEKPYKCPECKKSFTTASYLTVHARNHSGEKPYKCEECDKSFTMASNLKKHARTHSGEKLFQCIKCSKSFTTAPSLKRHARSHLSEEPDKC